MNKKPVQPQDKYVLRMPEGLRDRIKMFAERNNRSMNAEIIHHIEFSMETERQNREIGVEYGMRTPEEDAALTKIMEETFAKMKLVLKPLKEKRKK
jgi:hypothetical protein